MDRKTHMQIGCIAVLLSGAIMVGLVSLFVYYAIKWS